MQVWGPRFLPHVPRTPSPPVSLRLRLPPPTSALSPHGVLPCLSSCGLLLTYRTRAPPYLTEITAWAMTLPHPNEAVSAIQRGGTNTHGGDGAWCSP